ncbi:hypothetical protein IWC96_15250 [Brevundimonas sp. BAL450]|uniref:hypothetical protein n=1 Tax=Brevundimonas sp. BAL450 TaxID=1708162 RepID=UPI0018C987BA|nr:hypothetical protein [Brevundimonas sp. BAL450]MBG7616631.1 hypothetical protein [Brevundimonas sp. BAL450]
MRPAVVMLGAAALAAGAGALPTCALGQADPSSNFEIQAEKDSAEVAIVLGGWDESTDSNTRWTVRFSTPLGGGDRSADFITDGGLSGSTAVRASYGWLLHGEPGPWGGEGPRAPVRQLIVSGGIGHQSLEFRDFGTLDKQEVSRTPYALSLSVGGEWPSRSFRFPYYLGFGVEHTREYRGSDERTLCGPMPTSGPQECFTASFGEPRAQDTTAAYFIGRVQGENLLGLGLPFAVEVQPAYDFESEVSEVATTLFLLPDGDGRLRGGLRFRWRSADDDPTTDDDHFAVGAFVGVPFSLYAPAGNR